METKTWVPEEIPLDKPNVARVYDYWLGGYHNFEADRKRGDMAAAIYPDIKSAAAANRAFLRRIVQFIVGQGVDQFLDLGSGLPTVGNVHEVAQAVNPAAHVVYVDKDPVAVAHSLAILTDNPYATAIQADVREPDRILNHPEVKRLLDFDRPVAVLMLLILHAIPEDEDVRRVVRTFRDALAPGSYIAISHATSDGVPQESLAQLEKLYAGGSHKIRSIADIRRLFEGLELLEPGVVYTPLWRPEGPDDVFMDCPERAMGVAGVGRKSGNVDLPGQRPA